MYTYQSMISEMLWQDKANIDAYFGCYQEPIGKSIKIIKNKIDIDAFHAIASEYNWVLTKQQFTPNNDIYYITRSDEKHGLGKHRLHTLWFFYMQEVAASLPTQCLPIKQWDIVLDMCAAPWGKSVQIADKWWFVVSNEVSWSRIIPLQYNLNRTWMYTSCVTSIQWWQRGNIMPEFFDHILVDAPCSWEGTGFKSDDWIKWWQQDNVLKIARLQKELLSSAIKACKPWWTIIYSTCTINPWENEWVVSYALDKYKDIVSLENVDIEGKSPWVTHWEDDELLSTENAGKLARFWPHIQHTWGFFIARLKKHSSTGWDISDNKKNTKQSQLDMSDSLQQKVSQLLYDDFGITIDQEKYFFVSSQKKVYVTSPAYTKLHNIIFTEKTGIPIYKINNNWQRSPLHWLWQCLWAIATKNIYSLQESELQKYSEWFDIPVRHDIQTSATKYVILQREKYWVSVWKIVDWYIKNKCIK